MVPDIFWAIRNEKWRKEKTKKGETKTKKEEERGNNDIIIINKYFTLGWLSV